MDRPRIKRASVLGMGAVLAMAGCHGVRNHREIPAAPPLSREGESAQFHSDPNPIQTPIHGPTIQGGAGARGGGGAFPPGAGGITPPAAVNADQPPASDDGPAGGAARTSPMGMPPGY